jgi:hypothetical protein
MVSPAFFLFQQSPKRLQSSFSKEHCTAQCARKFFRNRLFPWLWNAPQILLLCSRICEWYDSIKISFEIFTYVGHDPLSQMRSFIYTENSELWLASSYESDLFLSNTSPIRPHGLLSLGIANSTNHGRTQNVTWMVHISPPDESLLLPSKSDITTTHVGFLSHQKSLRLTWWSLLAALAKFLSRVALSLCGVVSNDA